MASKLKADLREQRDYSQFEALRAVFECVRQHIPCQLLESERGLTPFELDHRQSELRTDLNVHELIRVLLQRSKYLTYEHHGLTPITDCQVDLDEQQLGLELELVESVPAAELHHLVHLSLHLAKLFDLKVPLEPAKPKLCRLTLILVQAQVLGHVSFDLLRLLRLLAIQTESVNQGQNCEVVLDCQMVHPKTK